MKRDRDNQGIDLSGRIKSLEQFTGSLVARHPEAGDGQEQIPINEAPPTRVPNPRRSRIFLRSGGGHEGGHGVFADLTLTAPHPSVATD
ncbi:hypothetical protein [Nocardioides ganghwensis]|jgi:hypothetical protein|uniref:Uncharacterized protein n=1 Tax=Nocardioides ganghwensis TaxID=252230 RepID=A0A4Q2SIU2_9ACTN|nr:hypothetical protein [Nocardioides ganghwensis]MBD3944985.1 hypothetical protein [Nocardioides ganghwensis]RYC05013.1 hypothetical protein EUA07_00505 [Nocardioides ganghwensis]